MKAYGWGQESEDCDENWDRVICDYENNGDENVNSPSLVEVFQTMNPICIHVNFTNLALADSNFIVFSSIS